MIMIKRIVVMLIIWIICQLAYIAASICSLVAIFVGHRISWKIFVVTDRLANTILGGNDTETLSSRSHRGSMNGILGWCLLCKLLDRIDKDHCKRSEGI